jgi:hypothetical protein
MRRVLGSLLLIFLLLLLLLFLLLPLLLLVLLHSLLLRGSLQILTNPTLWPGICSNGNKRRQPRSLHAMHKLWRTIQQTTCRL